MEQTFLTIECKTNMHVGSGKSNYGVIDQLVQRDATFDYPTIHASSLKGAIKEHCHHLNFGEMKTVFGSEKLSQDTQIGEYKFFDGMLLCFPVRCDKQTFVHITCPNILNFLCDSLPKDHSLIHDLNELVSVFNNDKNADGFCFTEALNDAVIEDFDITAKYKAEHAKLLTEQLIRLFKYEVVMLQNNVFDRLADNLHLPVIARNYLENGESKNLWYEQVMPRLSRFWSMAIHPTEVTPQGGVAPKSNLFSEVLFADNTIVQIGANGSVGYGYCMFDEIN